MGQYFRFRNWKTSEACRDIPFSGDSRWCNNGNLTWMPKIYHWPQEGLKELFGYVAEKTGWPQEEIEAVGDWGSRVYFDGEEYIERAALSESDPIVRKLWGEEDYATAI